MASRDERMDLGWDLLEQGEYEAAAEAAEALLEEEPDDVEALFLAGSALFEAGDDDEASVRLRRALELDPSNLPACLTLAALHYERCRFPEATLLVDRVLRDNPDNAYAHYLRGLLHDMGGRIDLGDASFQEASRLDPEHYPVSPSVPRAEFDRAVEEAFAAVPQEFRDRVGHLPILVEEVPSEDLLGTLEDPAPDLLGLFVGTPLTEKTHHETPRVPDAIYLFKRNLERACRDRDDLVEEIGVTLLHEIGHYLGMDEDDLDEAGYA
jgi:predicted Zn-dependent protease with MMP-like domain